ncbi:MAG: radical SAM protein [Candidatus Dormibacteraeota bacterium]|nr:radical SAM protein [Candidatus Dormibacteraeota bacterium]
MSAVHQAIDAGALGGRLWLYTNYHCNLECAYCLTESAPRVARRELSANRIGELASEARAVGFTAIGVTGGEPFLVPCLSASLLTLARELPTLVLSNGTLFTSRLIDELKPLAELDFAIQISLDSAEPDINDEMRGARNFARVVAAIPLLRAAGIKVRLATTSAGLAPDQLARLCTLHRSLGIADEDHIVRPVIARGRAAERGFGTSVVRDDLPAELTITADGAFWSPFGPTVRGGRLDTDLLITRTTRPLATAAAAVTRLALSIGAPVPSGALGIR